MSQTPPPGGAAGSHGTSTPSWDELLGPDEARERSVADEQQQLTRRELRDREAAHAAGRVRTRDRSEPAQGSFGFPDTEPPKRKRRWVPWVVAPLVLLLVIGGGGAAAAFLIMPDWPTRIASYLEGPEEKDYTGAGHGEVDIVVQEGDIGSDIAVTLERAGVTKTFEAFYGLLLAEPETPVFQPGTYRLKEEMSARAALDALLDPANKLQNEVLIREGETIDGALATIAASTEIPIEELQAAAADWGSFGLPPGAQSLEGFLYPATYTFDPGMNAHQALQMMVDRGRQELDSLGVPVEDRFRIVTFASLIQRESGPNIPDMAKIARVFQNRLDQGMHLESDASVSYGTGRHDSVFTTNEERADASNPYNTYANPGLPAGPIGNPGADALNAAMHPADGSWIFFATVNLQTGETVFSTTIDEHDAAVRQLQQWCAASDANAAYCG